MQQHNDWSVEDPGHHVVGGFDEVPEFLDIAPMREEQWVSMFQPMALDLSGDVPAALLTRTVVKKDLVLGTGGALLAHALIAVAFSFMAFIKPMQHLPEPVIDVFFIDSEQTGQSSGVSESSEPAPVATGSSGTAGPEQVTQVFEPPSESPTAGPDSPQASLTAAAPIPKPREVKRPLKTIKTRDESRPATTRSDPRRNPAAAEDGTRQEAPPAESPTEAPGNGVAQPGHGTGENPGISSTTGSPSGNGITGEFEITRVDKVPQVLKRIEPVYPGRARTLEICGKVVVRFLVEPDGRVSKPSVVEAHPSGYFEQSTLDAIRQWRFRPGSLRGHAVATWVTLPVQFRLTGQD